MMKNYERNKGILEKCLVDVYMQGEGRKNWVDFYVDSNDNSRRWESGWRIGW